MPFKTFCSYSSSKAKILLLVLATSVAGITVGCGMGASAPAGQGLGEHEVGSLNGLGYGGQVPIVGGTVYAFVAGKTGYGSAATPLAVATTDTSGAFSFSAGNTIPNAISCPSGSGTLYLYLYGGNGGTTSNNATANAQSLLMAVLGDCATVVAANPFVNINEISTFAAVTAMQGFFNPTAAATTTTFTGSCPGTGSTTTCTTLALGLAENFGTSATNIAGLTNAAATAGNLFNTASNVTGPSAIAGPVGPIDAAISAYAITSNVASFTTAAQSPALTAGQQVFLTGFPTSAFLDGQIVTVLSGGLSSTSFTAAVTHADVSPTTEAGSVGTAAVITITPESSKLLTAANVLATCVNSVGGSGTPCATLFSNVEPSTSTVVVQDTLQAAYFMATNPMSTSDGTVSGTSNMATVFGLVTANGKAFSGDLSAAPADWTLGVTYGSTSTNSTGTTFLMGTPEYIAVDSSSNLWILNWSATNGSLTELSNAGKPLLNVFNATNLVGPDGITIDPSNNIYISNYGKSGAFGTTVLEYTATGTTNTFTTGAGPEALASDGVGDIFVAETSASGGAAELRVIPAASTTGTTATILGSSILSSSNSGIAVDSNWNVYVTGATTTNNKITPFPYNASNTPKWSIGTPYTPSSCYYNSYSLSIDSSNNIWAPNTYGGATAATHALCEYAYVGATTPATPFTVTNNFTNSQLITAAHGVLDGSGNEWMADDVSGDGVVEMSSTGKILSPGTAGFIHTYNVPYAIAVDGSGNVWVGNNITASSTVAGYVTEIVGAATPVITPISAGLPVTAGGISKLATRP